MGAVVSPLAEGADVRIFLDPAEVSLRVGSPREIWAMTHPDSNGGIAVRPSSDGPVTVTHSAPGTIVASGQDSIAYVQCADQVASAPQPDRRTRYTVIVPTGTVVTFYPRETSGMELYLYGSRLEPTEVIAVV